MTNKDMFENLDRLDDAIKMVKEFDKKLKQEFKDVDITALLLSYALREVYHELQEEYKGIENIENIMIDMIARTIRGVIRELNKDANMSDRGSYRFHVFMSDWDDNSSLFPYLSKEIEELIDREVIKYTVQSQMIVEIIARVNDKEEFNKYMLSHHFTNNKQLVLDKIASDIGYAFKRKFFDGNTTD